jgi:hypothetical protein
VRDAVQRAAPANRRYGYRRIAAQLRGDGLNGFVVSVVLFPGNYGGTAFPSVPALEADLIKAVRDEIPHALVELLDQGEIAGESPGQYRKRAYFRFRLNNGDGWGVTP